MSEMEPRFWLRKPKQMTKKTMSGVWVASEWNQADNCWNEASTELRVSELKSEKEVKCGGGAARWRRVSEGGFVIFVLLLFYFVSHLNCVLPVEVFSREKLTKKNYTVSCCVALGRWRGRIWFDKTENVCCSGGRGFLNRTLDSLLFVTAGNNSISGNINMSKQLNWSVISYIVPFSSTAQIIHNDSQSYLEMDWVVNVNVYRSRSDVFIIFYFWQQSFHSFVHLVLKTFQCSDWCIQSEHNAVTAERLNALKNILFVLAQIRGYRKQMDI